MTDISVPHIIMVTSLQEAIMARKFLVSTITATFNVEYTAFASDEKTVFIYPNNSLWSNITGIFRDAGLFKLVSKPLVAVNLFLKGINCENCQHISDYLIEKEESRLVPKIKQEIIDQGKIESLPDRTAMVALIMMKYKIKVDKFATKKKKKVKKNKKSHFNKKRDCYLLYLTAYNDILLRYGPLRFMDLTRKTKNYPYLCRMKLSPAMALEGLIKVGALSNEANTTLVSIPDQIPTLSSVSTPIQNISTLPISTFD